MFRAGLRRWNRAIAAEDHNDIRSICATVISRILIDRKRAIGWGRLDDVGCCTEDLGHISRIAGKTGLIEDDRISSIRSISWHSDESIGDENISCRTGNSGSANTVRYENVDLRRRTPFSATVTLLFCAITSRAVAFSSCILIVVRGSFLVSAFICIVVGGVGFSIIATTVTIAVAITVTISGAVTITIAALTFGGLVNLFGLLNGDFGLWIIERKREQDDPDDDRERD